MRAADYASAVALELSQNTAGDYEVALKFKNGTTDDELKPLKMFGQDSLTLPQFISALDASLPSSVPLVCSDPPSFSGPPSTRLWNGVSRATRLPSADVLFSTLATINS